MSTELNMDMRALPGANALARAAALAAAAALPDPDPVATVSYRSEGRVLVIGSAADTARWQQRLPEHLVPSILALPAASGIELTGHLGAFTARWRNGAALMEGQFDLVLDLGETPLIAHHTPPHGYFAPGRDDAARAAAVSRLADMVGTFEKPKYFSYRAQRCAHGRNRIDGCTACVDICSARAIASAGDRIEVDPHLCAGCGACTTVCPTGAIAYAYPGAAYTGERLRAALAAYASAGGSDPVILFHGEGGRAVIERAGIPERTIPVELHEAASTGIDVWLAAVAYGAAGVVVLTTAMDAPQYRAALREQAAIAQTVLDALGYRGPHFAIACETPGAMPQGQAPLAPASFHVMPDKRNTLELALAHLHAHAPHPVDEVALPAGAPFGAVAVDTARCSLCMSCVGACPSSALVDSTSAPRLAFIEQNCVQCGLCVKTCPEQAVALVPRLSFGDARRQAVTLHETEPFCCISCGKPFGTLLMVEAMLSRLGGHPAFAGHPERLRMCGDCRVVDMMKNGQQPLSSS